MPSQEPAIDGDTQVKLFRLRSGARNADIERRSQMGETVALTEEADAEISAQERARRYAQSERQRSNAEQAIVDLLKHNTAFQRTIAHLVDAWGDNSPPTHDMAERILEEQMQDIARDSGLEAKARLKAKQQIDSGTPFDPPKLRRRSPGR